MLTGRIHIAAKFVDIEAHHADDVRAIDCGENALAACQSTELFRRKHNASRRGDVTEEHHSRARRDRIIKLIQHLRRVLHRFRQCDLLYHHAVTFRAKVPGVLAAGMLLIRHEHFVTRLHVNSVCDVAVRFRRVAEQGKLVALAAHECGQRIAKFIPGGIAPDGIIFRVPLSHFLRLVIAIENGA